MPVYIVQYPKIDSYRFGGRSYRPDKKYYLGSAHAGLTIALHLD
jgi:hypothetical protein